MVAKQTLDTQQRLLKKNGKMISNIPFSIFYSAIVHFKELVKSLPYIEVLAIVNKKITKNISCD